MRAGVIFAIPSIFSAVLTAGFPTLAGQNVTLAKATQATEFNITLANIPIASASMQTSFYAESYKMQSHFHSAGLAHVIAEMEALTQSSGGLYDGQARPDSYLLNLRQGKKTRRYDVTFNAGDVLSTTIDPPRKKKPDNWIEVEPADLKGVVDPLAALIRPGGSDPCVGTLSIYGGELRFDLLLAPKEKRDFSIDGFNGKVDVCSVRFQPRSGFRPGRDDLEYFKKLKNMEVWFAKSSQIDAYAPVVVAVPTKYGELKITATRFDR